MCLVCLRAHAVFVRTCVFARFAVYAADFNLLKERLSPEKRMSLTQLKAVRTFVEATHSGLTMDDVQRRAKQLDDLARQQALAPRRLF